MARPKKTRLKLMVASTVYNFEAQLDQICAMLGGYGYEVWNSHFGTIPRNSSKSNLDNCLVAVNDCDAFLGIIRPFYGSGKIEGEAYSFTHREMLEAIRLKKPRWFFVDDHVVFARQLLKQYMQTKSGRKRELKFEKTQVMDDLRVIEMYEDAVQLKVPIARRTGNWCQTYRTFDELLRQIDSEFKNAYRVSKIC